MSGTTENNPARDPGHDVARPPTAEDVLTARATLVETLACLDRLGFGPIATHVCLALDRLDEAYPPSGPA